jgi:TetR/AcrR family transcriptional regulator, regulator of cefoperazone and chloramphenicol sensitivity
MVAVRFGARTLHVGGQNGKANVPEVTRARLVDNALHLFARHGFDGVTTRTLSAAANTNISSIAYHFGGKEGLYDAVFAQVRTDFQKTLTPALTSLNHGVAVSGRDKKSLARVTREFLRSFFNAMLGDPQMQDRIAIVAREFARRSEGFGLFYSEAARPLQTTLANLVAASGHRSPEAPETIIQVQCLIGQLVSFLIIRQVLWTRLNWHSFTPERIDMITNEATVIVLRALSLGDVEVGQASPSDMMRPAQLR